jgi:predicted Zn-dependent protease with MMP-like domain
MGMILESKITPMLNISLRSFEDIVHTSFDALPAHFREQLRNVEIIVKDVPDAYELDLADIDDPDDLLGFYDGIPLTERSFGYDMTVPDVIYIYRRAHLLDCETPEQLHEETARTLRHEIAHYFGIDDDRLDELGAY